MPASRLTVKAAYSGDVVHRFRSSSHQWTSCHRISGRHPSERVDGMLRNRWSAWAGSCMTVGLLTPMCFVDMLHSFVTSSSSVPALTLTKSMPVRIACHCLLLCSLFHTNFLSRVVSLMLAQRAPQRAAGPTYPNHCTSHCGSGRSRPAFGGMQG